MEIRVSVITRTRQVANAGGQRFLVAAGDCTSDKVKALRQTPYVDKALEPNSIDVSNANKRLGFQNKRAQQVEMFNETKRWLDESFA